MNSLSARKRIELMKANLIAMRNTTALEASVMEMGKVQREKELNETWFPLSWKKFKKVLALMQEYNKDLNLLESEHLKLRKEMEELVDYHIKCLQGSSFDGNVSNN